MRLEPVSIDLLARAAMDYEKDPETLNYLLRSARRVSAGREGFALSNKQSQALHFCWVAPFENFEMAELKRTLHEPGPSSMLLFDCWTPQAQRGRGYYGLTISLVAHCLLQRAQRPWIFSASTNSSSMRGLERTGAIRSFALVRRPGLLGARISISNSEPRHTPAFDLHPAA